VAITAAGSTYSLLNDVPEPQIKMEHGNKIDVWNLMRNVVVYFKILSRNFFGVA
jgi:hypothetical protein